MKKQIEEMLAKYNVSSTSNRVWIIAHLLMKSDHKTDIDALLSAALEDGQSKSTTYRNLALLQRQTVVSILRRSKVALTKMKMEITIV